MEPKVLVLLKVRQCVIMCEGAGHDDPAQAWRVVLWECCCCKLLQTNNALRLDLSGWE
jgi:hypothetical protein